MTVNCTPPTFSLTTLVAANILGTGEENTNDPFWQGWSGPKLFPRMHELLAPHHPKIKKTLYRSVKYVDNLIDLH
jgi:hypothetical protein